MDHEDRLQNQMWEAGQFSELVNCNLQNYKIMDSVYMTINGKLISDLPLFL